MSNGILFKNRNSFASASGAMARMLTTTAILCFTGVAAMAQDVTLTSLDGGSQIKGEMVGYDGYSYTIRTVLGEITAQAELFSCEGDACPELNRLDSGFRLISNYDRVGDLAFALLSTVAQKEDADVINDITAGVGTFTVQNQKNSVTVKVDNLASEDAFAELLSGRADVVVVNRQPTEDERNIAKAVGIGDLLSEAQQHVIVEDGVSIIVGDDVNLQALSFIDLADVFSGDITDWADFGLKEGSVNLYGTVATESAHETFKTGVMSDRDFAANITLLPTSEDVLRAVEADPNGIAFLNHSIARNGMQSVVPLEDQCGRLFMPNDFSIKMGEYPLASFVYAYVAEKPASKLARAFHAESISDEGQAFLSAFNLIDALPATYGIDGQGRRMLQTVLPSEVDMTLADTQKFFEELEFANRLSVNLTYEQGTGELIQESQQSLEKLADMLKQGQFDGKEILFVGFTDSIGRPDINQQTSEERAAGVLERFEAIIPPERFRRYGVSSVGFGELSPLFCNDEPAGRAGNRRVEIWIREQL